MLKIKSFLLALCVSPLTLTAFQMPSIAGGVSNAGAVSGVINGSTASFSTPNTTAPAGAATFTATPAQNSAVNVVVTGLSTTAPLTLTLITSVPINATTDVPNAFIAAGSAFNSEVATTNQLPSSITLEGNAVGSGSTVTVSTTPATATTSTAISVAASSGAILGAISAPTTTTAGSVTINGVRAEIPVTTTAALATQATTAAIAVLLAGGTSSQAAAAATIAGAGASVTAAVNLIQILSNLVPGGPIPPTTGAVPQESILNASLLKSFDGVKELRLAQSKGGSINPARLAAAINAYNEILDTSSSAVISELSKNKEFVEIGQTLRKLRSAFAD